MTQTPEQANKTKSFEGYKNYPTWLIHLWLTSTEQSYLLLLSLAKSCNSVEALAEKAEELVMSYKPLKEHSHTVLAQMYEDLIDDALSQVNWVQVVQFIWEHPIEENIDGVLENSGSG